jgi:hypothetical protein
MPVPMLDLAPGDTFARTVNVGCDLTGWSVDVADITWSDGQTSALTVDLEQAADGLVGFWLGFQDTAGRAYGAVHRLRLRMVLDDVKQTFYFAIVRGVKVVGKA